jgi:capsular polysaccharide biosynthesis protein
VIRTAFHATVTPLRRRLERLLLRRRTVTLSPIATLHPGETVPFPRPPHPTPHEIDASLLPCNPAQLFEVPQGISTSDALTLNRRGQFIESLCEVWEGRPHLVRLPPTTHVSGSVLSLATNYSGNYYHWMFNVLPRLHIASHLDIDATYVDQSQSFQRESLELLGIQNILPPHPAVSADHLYVPSFPLLGAVPSWAIDWLRSLWPPSPTLGRRLYISRADAPRRHLLNEEQLARRLNLEVVTLTGLTIAEQARLFSEANLIVAPHGAALTNLIFCHPGTEVVELFAPRFQMPCFWALAHRSDLNYSHLIGRSDPTLEGRSPVDDHISLELDHACRILGI